MNYYFQASKEATKKEDYYQPWPVGQKCLHSWSEQIVVYYGQGGLTGFYTTELQVPCLSPKVHFQIQSILATGKSSGQIATISSDVDTS